MATFFFHDLHRKYLVMVGAFFDRIFIFKDQTEIKVPVSYVEKNKLIERFQRRDISFKGVSMTLPRISYEFTNMYYDPERKLNRLFKFVSDKDETSKYIQYTPVPYNIEVEVTILGNKNIDVTQIVEQILPRFTPDIKITSNLIPENNVELDLSLCLNSVYVQDSYEGLVSDKRLITYGLNLTLKGYFFREITDEKLITETISNFYNFDGPEMPEGSIIITPNDL